jgi:hypothetical protein
MLGVGPSLVSLKNLENIFDQNNMAGGFNAFSNHP